MKLLGGMGGNGAAPAPKGPMQLAGGMPPNAGLQPPIPPAPVNPAIGRLGNGPMSRDEWRRQEGAPTGVLTPPGSTTPNDPNRPPIDSALAGSPEYWEPQAMQGQNPLSPAIPVNPATSATPAISKPLTTREKIEERRNRDYSKKKSEGGAGDEDRNWWDGVKGAGIGFLKAFAQAAPRMSISDKLMAGLGGAGMGAVQGVVDPNTDEKFVNQGKLGQLYEQDERETAERLADSKQIKSNADAEGSMIDNVNKRSKDLLTTYMADNHIDEFEAENLRKLTGLPHQANDWRKVIRMDEQGVPFIAREGEEAARPDPSRPINPSETIKNRTVDGQTYAVPDKSAYGGAVNVAVGNAGREQSASQYQTTQATNAAEKQFQSVKERTIAQGKAKAASTRVAAAEKSLERLKSEREQLAGQGYSTEEKDKQILETENKLAAAQADKIEADGAASVPLRPKNPGTSKGGKNNNIGTMDDYNRAMQKIKGGRR